MTNQRRKEELLEEARERVTTNNKKDWITFCIIMAVICGPILIGCCVVLINGGW